jgi:hypothetical protein
VTAWDESALRRPPSYNVGRRWLSLLLDELSDEAALRLRSSVDLSLLRSTAATGKHGNWPNRFSLRVSIEPLIAWLAGPRPPLRTCPGTYPRKLGATYPWMHRLFLCDVCGLQ